MGFQEKLEATIKKNNSLICVGLDTEFRKIPRFLLRKPDPIFEFNKAIINATLDLVCAYKPNIAFYEAGGAKGIRSLKKTVEYLRKSDPLIPIILDAKRADIGHTNQAYTSFIFEYLKVDSTTLHPYLGKEALSPFLSLKDRFFFILCRTSNPGAGEFQDLEVKGKKFYQYIAERVVREWNFNRNCGLVIGATYPEELKMVREIVGEEMLLLIPGVGKQGGDVEKAVRAGRNSQGLGIIINSSRGIIFASENQDFAQAARRKVVELRRLVNKYRMLPT